MLKKKQVAMSVLTGQTPAALVRHLSAWARLLRARPPVARSSVVDGIALRVSASARKPAWASGAAAKVFRIVYRQPYHSASTFATSTARAE
jgi:hypothetical protein